MKTMIIRLFGFSIIAFVLLSCGKSNEQSKLNNYNWQLRDGFPKPDVPADNPMSTDKIELGRHLFYDKRLSGNGQQACASCHLQENAFAEAKKVSVGSTGQHHRRNSLALVNIAYNKTLTWAHDGLMSIEQQLLLPMFGEAPIELGITGNETEILTRLKSDVKYQTLFANAFPQQEVSFDIIVKALASFVRSLVSLNSPFDKYAYDLDDAALTPEQLNGMTLFFSEKLECHHCHGGFNFTQSTSHEKQPLDRRPFHNTGLYNVAGNTSYPKVDTGLYEVSLNPRDVGRFRAPTLRNIEMTAPYMHDGSMATLEEVVDFYAAGGRVIESGEFQGDGRLNPLKSQFVKGFDISAEDKRDLIDFMTTLTDPSFLSNKAFSNPWLEVETPSSTN